MDLRAQLVRPNRDDAEAHHLALVVVPPFPQAAKGELPAFVDVDGLLAASSLLPFIEAVRQYETTPLPICLPECGLACERFTARIDEAVAIFSSLAQK